MRHHIFFIFITFSLLVCSICYYSLMPSIILHITEYLTINCAPLLVSITIQSRYSQVNLLLAKIGTSLRYRY